MNMQTILKKLKSFENMDQEKINDLVKRAVQRDKRKEK